MWYLRYRRIMKCNGRKNFFRFFAYLALQRVDVGPAQRPAISITRHAPRPFGFASPVSGHCQ